MGENKRIGKERKVNGRECKERKGTEWKRKENKVGQGKA